VRQVFRLIPVRVPYWRRYAPPLPTLRMVCLAQLGFELWSIRSDGDHCWLVHDRAWHALDQRSVSQVLAFERQLQIGEGGTPLVELDMQPCEPLEADCAQPDARTGAAQGVQSAVAPRACAEREVLSLSSWSDRRGFSAGGGAPVKVVTKRRRAWEATPEAGRLR